jgi:hypothetical protein
MNSILLLSISLASDIGRSWSGTRRQVTSTGNNRALPERVVKITTPKQPLDYLSAAMTK